MRDGALLAAWQRLCEEADDRARKIMQSAGGKDLGPEENRDLGAKLSELFQNGLNRCAGAIFKEARFKTNGSGRLRLERTGLEEGRLANKSDTQRLLRCAPNLVNR